MVTLDALKLNLPVSLRNTGMSKHLVSTTNGLRLHNMAWEQDKNMITFLPVLFLCWGPPGEQVFLPTRALLLLLNMKVILEHTLIENNGNQTT